MRYGPLRLFGNAAEATRLAQAMARPEGRELLLAMVREAHDDAGAAIDPRPELPTVSPAPGAGEAATPISRES